jgi:hypothetical protein
VQLVATVQVIFSWLFLLPNKNAFSTDKEQQVTTMPNEFMNALFHSNRSGNEEAYYQCACLLVKH